MATKRSVDDKVRIALEQRAQARADLATQRAGREVAERKLAVAVGERDALLQALVAVTAGADAVNRDAMVRAREVLDRWIREPVDPSSPQ